MPLLLCLTLASACTEQPDPGSAARPWRILTFPGLRGDAADAAMRRLSLRLQQQSGLSVELRSPVDYFDAVRALGDQEAELAFLNDMSFIAGRKFYGLQARLQVLRAGRQASHRAQIMFAPGLDADIASLNGRRMAYVDPYSVSGFFAAAQKIKKSNVKLGTYIFSGAHIEALRQVLTGQADALATYVDDAQHPGVPKDIYAGLSAKEREQAARLSSLLLEIEIPNEPLVMRKKLPPDKLQSILRALQGLPQDAQLSKDLLLLGGIRGFAPASDQDYTQLARMLKDLDKEAEEALPGGWKLRCVHSQKMR